MAVHCLRMLPKPTDKDIMDRKEAIKFKLMPDGHIRAFQSNTPDLRGISELQIYPPHLCSPTITVAHCPKLLITDEAILTALHNIKWKEDT